MAKKQMLYTQVGYNELVEELNYLKNMNVEDYFLIVLLEEHKKHTQKQNSYLHILL